MNVLFDGQVFAMQATGGISRYFVSLLTHLNERSDVRARVLAPLHRNEYLAAAPRHQVLGLGLPASWGVGRACRVMTAATSPLASRFMRPDIVHETYFSAEPIVRAAARRITTMYDMIHEIFALDEKTTQHKRASLARCDHVLCISHQTRRDLCERFAIPEERTSVVHLGYQDFAGLRDPAEPLAREPYFLYVGARRGYKNFEGLLRAFAASERLKRDFRVVCFGGGPLRPAETALAAELGLEERHLKQVVGNDARLGSVYASATAFVYPSLYEGFGLPPLEAMSAGCPVLASNTSSIPEVVGEAALLVDPHDLNAIREGLERLADDADLRRRLVALGHQRRRQFTWARCAEETAAVYRAVL